MSVHTAPVVKVELVKHSNADSLSIVYIDGFQVVVNTEAWAGISHGVYIEPETIVDLTRPEFNFLDKPRLKAKRLRGQWSMGLLVPAPAGTSLGDDCWDYFGLTHYEPEEHGQPKGIPFDAADAPAGFPDIAKYDIENLRKYPNMFPAGELVNVTEKLHGANCAYLYSGGQYHVRSRSYWRKPGGQFWDGLNGVSSGSDAIMKWLRDNPDTLLYGELIGQIQKGFDYGVTPGQVRFKAFDIRDKNLNYMDVRDFRLAMSRADIPRVNCVGDELQEFDFDALVSLAEGTTLESANHIREGIVIKPATERTERNIGRVIGKLVSNKYLEKS